VIKNILRKIRLLSNARKEPYFLFYKVLGFYPDKIDYYQLAIRHKSVSILTEDGHNLSNERLEFLGDAVLNSVVTDILYNRYEDQREGFLTNTRSKIVKQRLIRTFINLDEIAENEVNFKSKLIEWTQKYKLESEFVLVDDVLSKSNKHIFQTRLVIQGKSICEASGASKKESQQLVSKIAYQQILSNPDFLKEFSQETPEIIDNQVNHLTEGDV